MFLIQLQLYASRHNLRVFINCRSRVILLSVRVKAELRAVQQWRTAVAYTGILFGGGGVQQIQLRTEDLEKGILGAVAP